MKHILLFLNLFLVLLFYCTKSKAPLEPISKYYTSHNYEWTVDTLYAPGALQVLMHGIWGTDENNVWVVGHSDETKYQVWHWDGEKWENRYLLFPGHPHSLNAIYGFSESDIWCVGTDIQNYPDIKHRAFLIHYDGSGWRYVDGVDEPMALSIWGTNSSNLFVGCDSGLILHFNGSKWLEQKTGTISRLYSIQGFGPDQVFASGYHLDYKSPIDTLFYYFFEFNGSKWRVVDSFIDYPFAPPQRFGYILWASPEGKLYSVGEDGLYLWDHHSWTNIKSIGDKQLFSINGTGWNNIFTAGPWNNVYHFNGESWHRFEYFDKYFFDAGFSFWCNDKYVFMTAQKGYNSYVIRGKLIKRR